VQPGHLHTLRCLYHVNDEMIPFSEIYLPPKTKFTVKKYVPIGSVIIAKVKLINFQMTDLVVM
jgi:hypothetical protein